MTRPVILPCNLSFPLHYYCRVSDLLCVGVCVCVCERESVCKRRCVCLSFKSVCGCVRLSLYMCFECVCERENVLKRNCFG